jgi:hypothetical protein
MTTTGVVMSGANVSWFKLLATFSSGATLDRAQPEQTQRGHEDKR